MVKVDFKFTGFPTKNESIVVPNPKDIVAKGLPDIPGLKIDMEATMLEIMLGSWIFIHLGIPYTSCTYLEKNISLYIFIILINFFVFL